MKNYRPISLLSQVYEIFTKVITKRLERKLDENQTREQAGFRKNYSTMDHIQTINLLREKCRDFNLPLCLIYVDFEKAFDSVEIDAILRSLKNQGTELPYIHLLKNIYTNCTSTVALNGNKTQFEIRKGVRQGDTISPKLFTSCLEEIFHGINWSGKGVNIDGEHLHHLKFADDIMLISTNTKEAEILLNDLHSKSRKNGLKISRTKTKLTINDNISATPVKLEDSEIELTTEYIYLGQKISLQEPNQASEIKRRAQLGWVAFGKLHTIMRSNLPMSMKKKVFN